MEILTNFLHSYAVFHINAIYAITFFLKYNLFLFFVLGAICYIVYEELKCENANFVEDRRKVF